METEDIIGGDFAVTIYRAVEGSPEPMYLTVEVVEGDAPWAICNCGKVVVGPPQQGQSLRCCSAKETDLEWQAASYWVLDAFDEDGNTVELTPDEYRSALEQGEQEAQYEENGGIVLIFPVGCHDDFEA